MEDIVKLTVDPQDASQIEALIEEINAHAAMSDAEKQQLFNQWNEHQSELT